MDSSRGGTALAESFPKVRNVTWTRGTAGRDDLEGGRFEAQPVDSNVQRIAQVEREALLQRTATERIGDWIATSAGTATFAGLHALWFAFWILANCGLIAVIPPFDPYPFGFLTFVVSLEAIFLTIAVLISQNRMIKQADRRVHLDLQVNMLAEQQATLTLELVRRIALRLGVEPVTDPKMAALPAE